MQGHILNQVQHLNVNIIAPQVQSIIIHQYNISQVHNNRSSQWKLFFRASECSYVDEERWHPNNLLQLALQSCWKMSSKNLNLLLKMLVSKDFLVCFSEHCSMLVPQLREASCILYQ